MVDILLATYNGEKFLREQLNSLLGQSFKNFTILIRDDGSKDSTNTIIKEYEQNHPNIIKVVKDDVKTKNAKDNFFMLLRHSTKKYIMFCDQDDIWLNNKIEITLNAMLSIEKKFGNDTPILVHTDLKVVDKNLKIKSNSFADYQHLIKRDAKFNELLVQNNVTGCTVMVNRVVKSYIKNEFNKDILMHDWWLSLICVNFGRLAYIDEATILYRQHENNAVGAKNGGGGMALVRSVKNYPKMIKNFKDTVGQGRYFYKTYKSILNNDNTNMVKNFSEVLNFGFLKRVEIYNRYDLWKNSNIKRIAQALISK